MHFVCRSALAIYTGQKSSPDQQRYRLSSKEQHKLLRTANMCFWSDQSERFLHRLVIRIKAFYENLLWQVHGQKLKTLSSHLAKRPVPMDQGSSSQEFQPLQIISVEIVEPKIHVCRMTRTSHCKTWYDTFTRNTTIYHFSMKSCTQAQIDFISGR